MRSTSQLELISPCFTFGLMQPKIMQAMLVDQIFHPTNTSTIIPCLMVSRIRDPNPVQWRSPGNSISPFISPCFLFWREDSLHGKKSLKLWDINPLNLLPFQNFQIRDVLELPSWVTSTKGWSKFRTESMADPAHPPQFEQATGPFECNFWFKEAFIK